MIRAILGTLLFAVVVGVVVFFADHPGQVQIVWQGWQVATSVGVLLAAAVLAALAAAALFRVVSLVLGSPRAFVRRRRDRRRRAGYRALTQGMVAVAAGDPREARRLARKADALLAEPPLTLLLSAQAAQLEGDETAAKKFFTAMLERPETEFLGLRGLLNQALRAGEPGTALRLTRRAMTLRPNTPWVVENLFDLEAREGQWAAAEQTLAHAVKRRILPHERARHYRGIVLYELSCAAVASGDRRRGLNLAAQAHRLTSDLAGPAAHYAAMLLEDRRSGRAARVVERAWRSAPHPQLAQLYGTIHRDEAPLGRIKCFERLAAGNPNARESHIALAQAAFDAQLWGEARRHLERALAAPAPAPVNTKAANSAPAPTPSAKARQDECGTGATPRLCLMMARVEEAEHGAGDGVRRWLDRAVNAMPDPRYLCASCGGESPQWHSRCPHCGSFAALSWRTPAWAPAGSALSLPAEVADSDTTKLPAASSAGA